MLTVLLMLTVFSCYQMCMTELQSFSRSFRPLESHKPEGCA